MKGEIHRLLKERFETVGSIALKAGVSRPHLSAVLKNTPGRGGMTRRKVARWLTERELGCLGWSPGGVLADGDHGKGAQGVKEYGKYGARLQGQ